MFVIFGIILLVSACHSQRASIFSQTDANEISDENYLQSEEEIKQQLDVIDPSIIEDSKSKTVFYS